MQAQYQDASSIHYLLLSTLSDEVQTQILQHAQYTMTHSSAVCCIMSIIRDQQ